MVQALAKDILIKEYGRRSLLKSLGYLVFAIFRIKFPTGLENHNARPYLHTAYVLAVAIRRAGIAGKLTGWLFHGGWPWRWTMDWTLKLALLGSWATHAIAFAVGHREFSIALLLQLIYFGIKAWVRFFPNWLDYLWELSFVIPIGFLCYRVWHHTSWRKYIHEVSGHRETLRQ